jgi:hypothetical protein
VGELVHRTDDGTGRGGPLPLPPAPSTRTRTRRSSTSITSAASSDLVRLGTTRDAVRGPMAGL